MAPNLKVVGHAGTEQDTADNVRADQPAGPPHTANNLSPGLHFPARGFARGGCCSPGAAATAGTTRPWSAPLNDPSRPWSRQSSAPSTVGIGVGETAGSGGAAEQFGTWRERQGLHQGMAAGSQTRQARRAMACGQHQQDARTCFWGSRAHTDAPTKFY